MSLASQHARVVPQSPLLVTASVELSVVVPHRFPLAGHRVVSDSFIKAVKVRRSALAPKPHGQT